MSRRKRSEEEIKRDNRERLIAGTRLKNIIKEKGKQNKDLIIELNERGFERCSDSKFCDYTHGRRPIPAEYIPVIADYLDIDPGYLTDTSTFNMFTLTYDDYIKNLSFEDLYSNDFFIRNKAIFRLFGFEFGVYDDGRYSVFAENFKLILSRQGIVDLVDILIMDANKRIRAYMKEGDALG